MQYIKTSAAVKKRFSIRLRIQEYLPVGQCAGGSFCIFGSLSVQLGSAGRPLLLFICCLVAFDAFSSPVDVGHHSQGCRALSQTRSRILCPEQKAPTISQVSGAFPRAKAQRARQESVCLKNPASTSALSVSLASICLAYRGKQGKANTISPHRSVI